MSIQLPGSKSICNRLLMIDAIGSLHLSIENFSTSDDSELLKNALSAIQLQSKTIDVHHAGTDMRFLCAYLSTLPDTEYVLTGSERIKNRPIKDLVEALRSIGASIEYIEKEGYPPLLIKGKKLDGGSVEINSSISSQFISALLLIAPSLKNGLILNLKNEIVSQSYIKLTIHYMKLLGAQVNWAKTITVPPQAYATNLKSIYCESDWSAASYFYSAFVIKNLKSITLVGLHQNSIQPDSILVSLFELFGVQTKFIENSIELLRTETLPTFFEHDFTDCPDLAQTFSVLCFALQLPCKLTGLKTLKIKETDRIIALQNELHKLNAVIQVNDESLSIINYLPCDKNKKTCIETYQDHRMAMSFAPLLSIFPHLTIENPDVVSKSFPNFWEEFNKLA